MVTASDIAKLRAQTGAGMMDCKKALDEASGDMTLAEELLRKKGIVKAAKRADKVAAEGVTTVKTEGSAAVIVEVNSETDFVAQNQEFKDLVESVANTILSKKPANWEAAMACGIEEKLTALTGKIGEKISLRRFELVEKNDTQAFGAYVHMGGKISTLVLLDGTADAELARDVAMHAAAAAPKYLDRAEVPAEVLEKEKEIYAEQLKAQNKPANIIENIVKGKLDKFYSEVCLLEQPFIKDEEKSVAQYVQSIAPGAKVVKFYRYELGEGIEKKGCDFAAEVAEQLAK